MQFFPLLSLLVGCAEPERPTRVEHHTHCEAPTPTGNPASLEGLCVDGRVIRESGRMGHPHGPTTGFCAQIVTTDSELGGRQVTLVTESRVFKDHDRVTILLGPPTNKPNRQLKMNDVWQASWPEPYEVVVP